MLQALIWDVDGTLADTELQGHLPAFNAAFAEAGLPWHWDEATYLRLLATTGGKERILAWWHEVDPAAASAPGAASQVAMLHQRKTAFYLQLVAQGAIGLRPGVRRLLGEARAQGLRLAVATTTTADNVWALLRSQLGPEAEHWFAVVGAGDVVPHKKPAPDIYLWVLQRLGLPAGACLALEDSAAGVVAAQAAGLRVLVTRNPATAQQNLPPVLADLDGLGEPWAPARGRWAGQPWQGVVSAAGLAEALAAHGAWGAGQPRFAG